MKKSFIFQTGVKVLLPLLMIGSVILFWRGHQLPGGGFVGGLVAGVALATHAFCFDVGSTMRLIRFHPLSYVVFGLSCSLVSGMLSLFLGDQFLKGLWIFLPWIGDLGTPLLFDFGVMFAGGTFLLLRPRLFDSLIGLVLIGHAINLSIFVASNSKSGKPAIIEIGQNTLSESALDPVPQALLLTAIVISFGTMTLLAVLFRTSLKNENIHNSEVIERGMD